MRLAASLCWMALSVLLIGSSARADGSEALDQLLARLSKVEGLSADFREEKRLSLVAVPLKSEGKIYYQKPRRLARHTTAPTKSSVLLEGNVVRFGDAKRTESVGLDSQPAVRLLVDTFVSVLAGDKAALLSLASVSHEPVGSEGWRIRVVPKDAKLLRIVKSMSFEGRAAELASMELVDSHGDVTRTTFQNVRFGRLSPAQAKSVFRIGG